MTFITLLFWAIRKTVFNADNIKSSSMITEEMHKTEINRGGGVEIFVKFNKRGGGGQNKRGGGWNFKNSLSKQTRIEASKNKVMIKRVLNISTN